MARIEAMVYDTDLGEVKVTELMVNMVNTELLPAGQIVGAHTDVWDGPVADAKTSPFYKYFPAFIVNQDYNPRFMTKSRIKVLSLEIVDIEEQAAPTPQLTPEPVDIADIEPVPGS